MSDRFVTGYTFIDWIRNSIWIHRHTYVSAYVDYVDMLTIPTIFGSYSKVLRVRVKVLFFVTINQKWSQDLSRIFIQTLLWMRFKSKIQNIELDRLNFLKTTYTLLKTSKRAQILENSSPSSLENKEHCNIHKYRSFWGFDEPEYLQEYVFSVV